MYYFILRIKNRLVGIFDSYTNAILRAAQYPNDTTVQLTVKYFEV